MCVQINIECYFNVILGFYICQTLIAEHKICVSTQKCFHVVEERAWNIC